MTSRRLAIPAAALLAAGGLLPPPARGEEAGLVTRPSPHTVRETLDRFAAAVRGAGWVVFTEIDHAAAARDAGMALRARTVVFFGNPRAGTPAMAAHPTLAFDLPMRVLVWEDDQGRTRITRATGADLASRVFARHGIAIDADGQRSTDAMLDRLVTRAVE